MADIRYPGFAKGRGPGYWLRFKNLCASRKKFRFDNSNEWRYSFGHPAPMDRSIPFSDLLDPESSADEKFRFLIIGDTGEGDRSQYGFLPVIRALRPHFMIINGDIAYPAGRIKGEDRNSDDYLAGFFEPYRNLDIPIWSVPGNHEYYAGGQGREYYETFCTRKYANRWSKYGLRLVSQPGTYWELREPDSSVPLVVIGVDTGKTGNLDGRTRSRRRLSRSDDKQHSWLESRLVKADTEGKRVIVLFHIPALSRERNVGKVHLRKLHRIIASHKCVGLVVCGHDHNYQGYAASTLHRYIDKEHKYKPFPDGPIEYIITGGGGAYLTSTDFRSSFLDRLFGRRRYEAETLYPTPDQWSRYAKFGRKVIDGLGMSKSFIGRIVGTAEKDTLSDVDAAQYLNLLLVEVRRDERPVVTPVFMDDLKRLFAHLPAETILDVQAENLPIDPVQYERCLRKDLAFRL